MPTISDLEKVLADARKYHGDVELVLWDEDWSFTFERLEEMLHWEREERRLYIGGFRTNGDPKHNIGPG